MVYINVDTTGRVDPTGLRVQRMMVRIARMPRRMRDGDLTLRRLTLLSWFLRKKLLSSGGELNPDERGKGPGGAWPPLWQSMRTALPIAYCVEFAGKPVGLAGLYDLRVGESAGMSLMILDRMHRRKGYGRRVFTLLTQNLRRQRLVKKVFVEVETDNEDSLSFWRGLGFTQETCLQNSVRLSLSLTCPEVH
jgi:hypothetical protein